MLSRFAPGPSGAIRSGVAGRKPSGIPAATVLRPWCLGQFQLSFSAQPRRILAPPVMFTNPKGIPVEESDFSLGKGYSAAQF